MKATKRKRLTDEEWLQLVKEALEINAPIKINYRFKFKGKTVGSFLYRAKKSNNLVLQEKLKAIGFDFDKYDGKIARKKKRNEWLSLLKEAIEAGVKVQENHRFKYKGKNLGTFLVGAKKDKKLVKKIKKVGFNYVYHIKNPEKYAQKFIEDLKNCNPKLKPKFITRFYTYVLPKKEQLKEETIEEINAIWKNKFGDRRVWRHPMLEEQWIVHWKRFRYDKEKNPEEKWLLTFNRMGNLFSFAYLRKRKVYLMIRIEKYFTKKEIEELKSEGYYTDKYLKQ